jgi:hypothetical protein
VGTGKTFAAMALALRLAEQTNARHIMTVAPYITILNQSLENYQQSLILPGEDPNKVVMAYHHLADYSISKNWRTNQLEKALTVQLYRPITITTAVQLFESLAGYRTVPLKKLHNLPGSIIIVDEFDNCVPVPLWGTAARTLLELTERWGCKVICASGSPIEFWKIKSFSAGVSPKPVVSRKTKTAMKKAEQHRVDYRVNPKPLLPLELIAYVRRFSGPRIVICNTLRTAAVLAQLYYLKYGRGSVEHISTALTPNDRFNTIKRIYRRLQNPNDKDWTLFATSCVESRFYYRVSGRMLCEVHYTDWRTY